MGIMKVAILVILKNGILTTLRFHLSRYLRRVTTVVVPSTGTSSAMVKWRPRTYASTMNFLTLSLALPSEIFAKTSWKFWISASRPDSRTTRRFSLRHRNSKSRAKEGNLIKGALDDAGGNCLKSPETKMHWSVAIRASAVLASITRKTENISHTLKARFVYH